MANPREVLKEIIRHFEVIYNGNDFFISPMDGVFFTSIPLNLGVWLESEFEEEINAAMADFAVNEA